MTITDTFNRADTTTPLGTTSDGSATWVAAKGTWGISTNQAYSSALGGGIESFAVLDATLADGTYAITLPTSYLGGVIFRYSDASNYWHAYGNDGATGNLLKVVAGSVTNVSNFIIPAGGSAVEVHLAGASIVLKINGSTVLTRTDAFNDTATNFGLYAQSTGDRFDNFTFTPPAAAVYSRPTILMRGAAVTRAAVI